MKTADYLDDEPLPEPLRPETTGWYNVTLTFGFPYYEDLTAKEYYDAKLKKWKGEKEWKGQCTIITYDKVQPTKLDKFLESVVARVKKFTRDAV